MDWKYLNSQFSIGGKPIPVRSLKVHKSVLTSFDALSKKAQRQLIKQIDGELFEQDGVVLARENCVKYSAQA